MLGYLSVKILDLELAKPKSIMIDLIPTFGGSGLFCRKEQLVGGYDALVDEYCWVYEVGLERNVLELFYLHGESWKQICTYPNRGALSWALNRIVKNS